MLRRDFLGSTLGLFTGYHIPWIARTVGDKPIEQPKVILSDYRNYLKLDNHYTIQGPGVKEFKDGAIVCADIQAHCKLTVTRSIIYYKNKLLSDMPFVAQQTVLNGDTLKITHSLNIIFNNRIVTPGDVDWEYVLQKYLKSPEYYERHIHRNK
jgi:hypothetical protein